MDITLRPIDESNFIDCFNLQLGDGQDKFVSHPIRSLAQAYVYRDQCQPFGVYAGDTMIGYVMVIYDYDEEAYNIWHMMIDKAYQGRGYGTQAIEALSEDLKGKAAAIRLEVTQENPRARALYERMGFQPVNYLQMQKTL